MDNTFDQSEPLHWLAESTGDDEDLQRFIESLDDSLDKDKPQLLSTFNNEEEGEVPLALSDYAVEDPDPVSVHCQSFVPSDPLDCSGCILLREVVHSNGLQNVKLAIHGGLGVFYHAMLEITCNNVDGLPPSMEPSFIDLSAQSFEHVKQFLINYAQVRMHNGYVLIQDSVSCFYDALCVRMNFDVENTSGDVLPEQGLCQSSPMVAVNDPIRTEKTGISAQRERTANLRISDFADYFHLRIIDASKELGICPTVLKKTCRKYGMRRWPYRKVRSIDCKIKKLQDLLDQGGGQGAVNTQTEIEQLRAQRTRICHGFQPARVITGADRGA